MFGFGDEKRVWNKETEFPKGQTLKFSEKWAPEIRFKTALDPSKLYQIHMFRVTCAKAAKKKTRWIKLKSLAADMVVGVHELSCSTAEGVSASVLVTVKDER